MNPSPEFPDDQAENPTDNPIDPQLADPLADFRYKVTFTVTVVALTCLVILFFISTLSIIPLVIITILIAVFLRSLADISASYLPGSDRVAVIVVAVAIMLLLLLFFGLTGPSVVEQFSQLVERIPEALTQIEDSLNQYDWGVTLIDNLGQIPAIVGDVDIFSRLTGFFSNALGGLTTALLILIAGIYMALEPELYIQNFLRLFPIDRRARVHHVLDAGYNTLRKWLLARVLSMIVVGVLTLIGLSIIGVPLALTLAIIAGLFSIIPNIGPLLSALPAILVGMTESLWLGFLVAIVFLIVQQIESYFITPNIERQTVALPPALVMLSQVFLALVFGWLGLFIAAPLVAFGIILVKSFYIEDYLGDR